MPLKKFEITFSDNTVLTYTLITDPIVDQWVTLIQERTIEDCSPFNHYIGYASEQAISDKIANLYRLVDTINGHFPDHITKLEITRDSWESTLHIMHVHFPELKNDTAYEFIWDYLAEYNDIIHWLEHILPNAWSPARFKSKSSTFKIILDFNRVPIAPLSIPEESYNLFSMFHGFGDLQLHYTHVGKNAAEIFYTTDLVCPEDQFVPQRIFNASVRMHFTDNFFDTPIKQKIQAAKWQQFYDKRGGFDFWKYTIDDPKIAYGYIKIGKLESIVIDGTILAVPNSLEDMNSFREKLSSTTVKTWKIKGA